MYVDLQRNWGERNCNVITLRQEQMTTDWVNQNCNVMTILQEQMPTPIRSSIPRLGTLELHNVKPRSKVPPLGSAIGVVRGPRPKSGCAQELARPFTRLPASTCTCPGQGLDGSASSKNGFLPISRQWLRANPASAARENHYRGRRCRRRARFVFACSRPPATHRSWRRSGAVTGAG